MNNYKKACKFDKDNDLVLLKEVYAELSIAERLKFGKEREYID